MHLTCGDYADVVNFRRVDYSLFIIFALTVNIIYRFALYSSGGVVGLRPIWFVLCVKYRIGVGRLALLFFYTLYQMLVSLKCYEMNKYVIYGYY